MRSEELQKMLEEKSIREIGEVVEALRPLILSSIYKYYNKPYLYDELFQEGCVEVVEGFLDYEPERGISFPAYMKTRLRFFYLGKNRRMEILSLDEANEQGDALIDTLEDDFNLEEYFENQEQYRKLQIAISHLPPRQLDMINEFYLKGKSLKEIAKEYGLSYRSCVNSKAQGLKNLRKYLEREDLNT